MKISILPAAGITAASARLRAFQLCDALKNAGQDAAITVMEDADVLYIQKRITDDILLYAHHVRNRGGIVIYDLDDSGKRALDWLNIQPHQWQDMFALADAVTTDTESRRQLILQEYPDADIHLLSDSIDYCPPTPFRSKPEKDERLKVLWFGHMSNLKLITPYLETLLNQNLDFYIVTNPESLPQLRLTLPEVNFIPWTLDSFPTILRACDLAFLIHQGDVSDQSKSNNKMLASIVNGVVPIVSSTPEYAALATAVGAQDSIFSSPEELVLAIEKYRSRESRDRYLDNAQPFVFENYGPSTVAKNFLALVDQLKQKRQAASHTTAVGSNLLGNLFYDKKPSPNQDIVQATAEILRNTQCKTVIEVACHPGELLTELSTKFQVNGCDLSPINTFPESSRKLPLIQYDIFSTNLGFPTNFRGKTDGVLWYFAGCTTTSLAHIAQAMNNMMLLAAKKILVIDSPEICELMQSLTNSDKFIFIPVSLG